MDRNNVWLIWVFALTAGMANAGIASDETMHMSIAWENDAIIDDDGGYTNGFVYSWGRSIDEKNQASLGRKNQPMVALS